MAPSELAEIRALLIAQTETPEPSRAPSRAQGLLGIVGGLLKPRGEPAAPAKPLNLAPPPRRFPERSYPEAGHNDESMLLLGEEIDPDLFMPIDLPPPPRAEFGVRSPRPYLPHDSVLLLNKVAPAQPRRLTLHTDSGEAVGELFLTPQEAPLRSVYAAAERDEVPFFPGDLDEEPSPERPLRAVRPGPHPCPGLGRDLLQALALTLSREHEALSDRLLQTEKTGVSAEFCEGRVDLQQPVG